MSLRTKLILGLFAVGLGCVVGVTVVGAAVGEPKIEVTFSRYETNQNYVCAVMRVKNSGSAPAIFRGYSKTTPLLKFERKDSSGAWQPRIVGCGTGLSDKMLMPGQEVESREYISGKSVWRSGLNYRRVSWLDRLPEKIRWKIGFYPQMRWETVWSREHADPAMVDVQAGEESVVALE